jgi:hypothetical protein
MILSYPNVRRGGEPNTVRYWYSAVAGAGEYYPRSPASAPCAAGLER